VKPPAGRLAAIAAAFVLAVLALLPAAAPGATAGSATTPPAAGTKTATIATTVARPSTKHDELVPPGILDEKPRGHQLDGYGAIDLAKAVPKVRREVAKYDPDETYPGVYLKGPARWQVGYYTKETPPREIAQVTIDDRTARVTEAWTGHQVAWTMARGYPGAFGRKVNSPWVWIPLTVLFLLPFARRPLRVLHLDLAVLCAFGVSVAFFNDAQIDVSVPLAYPLLAYLLARLLWIGLRRPAATPPADPPADGAGPSPADRRAVGGLPLLVPITWLAVAAVFLVGFRIGLNVTSSNVIDVGYSGVIGAQKIVDGDPLYGDFPQDNANGDTYGPIAYAVYVPFEQALPWSGTWDDLPAAHAAAIVFDLAAIALLFLLGRRVRGPGLGVVLAYGWCAFPFTLYAMNTNTNDTLVAAFVLAAVLASAPGRRGLLAALSGMTKFASLALVPLFALHGRRSDEERPRSIPRFAAGFGLGLAVSGVLLLSGGDSLSTMFDRTVRFQAERGSPFSIWGLYEIEGLQRAWQVIAVALALGLAFAVRRRRDDIVGLAACAGAILVALQAGVTHWFYLYVVWVFPLFLLAVLGRAALLERAPVPDTPEPLASPPTVTSAA
jgi:hypothetical protein